MAQPPVTGQGARPIIVADPGESVSATRYLRPQGPRVWPLWLLILALCAALGAGGWLIWQERQSFQQQIVRLDTDVSNMHARFDAEDGRGDVIGDFHHRLEQLERQQQALLTVQQQLKDRTDAQQTANGQQLVEQLHKLAASQQDLMQQIDTLDATLTATRSSLAALEQTGDAARGALDSRLTRLEDARESQAARVASLTTRVDEVVSRLDTRLAQLIPGLESLDEQFQSTSSTVEEIKHSLEDERSQQAALETRLADLAAQVQELGRSQLAMSAQLEALR